LNIVKNTTSDRKPVVNKVLHSDDIQAYQALVRRVPVADNVVEYAVGLVHKTRPNGERAAPRAKQLLEWGAGPRASQYLIVAAKCNALLTGKYSPDIEDVRATIADSLDLSFNRIQFTPDLMPSDIVGSETLTQQRDFQFVKGPIFSNIILADEINRTPPKTQAALLESMQEYAVTVAGQRYPLARPFFVLATQNPIEQEGTYPLPEAQLDRFMFNIELGYPSYQEELNIVKNTTSDRKPVVNKVLH
nr:hypothetical protein [Tanacetum cinerariifolium]